MNAIEVYVRDGLVFIIYLISCDIADSWSGDLFYKGSSILSFGNIFSI